VICCNSHAHQSSRLFHGFTYLLQASLKIPVAVIPLS
jgi:hypothetical protein